MIIIEKLKLVMLKESLALTRTLYVPNCDIEKMALI
jgi:hypothetical protein